MSPISVQNDEGSVGDAVSYITVAEFKSYHTDRGNSYAGKTDTEIEQALVRATDYLDERFNYRGLKLTGPSQVTAWPRYDVFDADGRGIYGVPSAVKEATAEYALRALSTVPLNPDFTRGASGAAVQSITQSAGPVSESVTYVTGGGMTLPEYPAADNKLRRAGLVRNRQSGRVVRG